MALNSRPRVLLADAALCLGFFSRLPVPMVGEAGGATRPFGIAIRMLPPASLVIGACAALPMAIAAAAGVPHPMAAIVGVAAGVLVSGGLHEDGLADTADGLGGGANRGRKLAIMRDSRVGTFGVLALVLALAWRIAAFSALLDMRTALHAAALVMAAAVVSRALALLPMAVLRPARDDGLAFEVGTLDRAALAACAGLAAIAGVALPLAVGVTLPHALAACVLATASAAAVTRVADKQIGGYTGDIAGACQQVAEAGYLLGLLLLPMIG